MKKGKKIFSRHSCCEKYVFIQISLFELWEFPCSLFPVPYSLLKLTITCGCLFFAVFLAAIRVRLRPTSKITNCSNKLLMEVDRFFTSSKTDYSCLNHSSLCCYIPSFNCTSHVVKHDQVINIAMNI